MSSNKCAYPWQQMIIDLTGEVVPCCYWSGYGNFGKPLGNTNKNTIEEIWNGKGYKELRKQFKENDLDNHPCGNCMSYRWSNNNFPSFEWPNKIILDEGYCYRTKIFTNNDDSKLNIKNVSLYENEKNIGKIELNHDKIRRNGNGLFCLWNGWIYFSSSNNTDPNLNHFSYHILINDKKFTIKTINHTARSGKNLLKSYDEFKKSKSKLASKPSIVSLISTADCNIDCPSCSQNKVREAGVQHRKETIPNILNLVPYLSKFTWHGGEPYLIKRFRKFIDNFHKSDNPNLCFGFTSNATMITKSESEKLKKFPFTEIAISIDSFNKSSFEKIREGAKLDRVLENLKFLRNSLITQNHNITIGMIICKSNFNELKFNLEKAHKLKLNLNLSPVLVTPSIEQLNIFENFKYETKDWKSSLNITFKYLEYLKKCAFSSDWALNHIPMVQELEKIYLNSKIEHEEIISINLNLLDPFNQLKTMTCPGIIVYSNNQNLSYLKIEKNIKNLKIRIPKIKIQKALENDHLRINFVPDLYNEFYVFTSSTFNDIPKSLDLVINDKNLNLLKIKNIKKATYGETTPDGLNVINPDSVAKKIHISNLKKFASTKNHIINTKSYGNKYIIYNFKILAKNFAKKFIAKLGVNKLSR